MLFIKNSFFHKKQTKVNRVRLLGNSSPTPQGKISSTAKG